VRVALPANSIAVRVVHEIAHLGLASLIMDMLWCGFPETVDKLQPEIGHVHGPIPVFFLNCSASMLPASSTSSMGETEQALNFGAEQTIIMRDHSAKAKLQAELKDQALILTVLQSKGMEFDDVLLWNFFTDSPDPGGWRCLDALKIKSGDFDSKIYAAMCSELKQFYVVKEILGWQIGVRNLMVRLRSQRPVL
jgi:hypothetical protein